MRVAIVGVTGRIGKRVARALAERGHDVRGVNRRRQRQLPVLGDLPVGLGVADAGDVDELVRTVRGMDAVLMATAPTREDPQQYLAHTRNLLRAAHEAQVARVVVVSNYKALNAPDGRPMLVAEPSNPYFRELEEVFASQRDLLFAERGLDWLLVAPPADLFPYGEETGSWRTAEGTLVVAHDGPYAEASRLSMEDFALLVARELVEPEHSRTLLTAAYA